MSARFSIPRSMPWVLSLAVSLALHGLLAVVLNDWKPWAVFRDDTRPDPNSEPMFDDDDPQLGIDESDAVTLTWLGFAEPTPHSARLQSEIEQAALTQTAGVPGEPFAASEQPTPEPDTPEPVVPPPALESVVAEAPSELVEPIEPMEPVDAVRPAESVLAEAPDWTPDPARLDASPLPEVSLPADDARFQPPPSIDPASGDPAPASQSPPAEPSETESPPADTPPAPNQPPPSETGVPNAEDGEPSDRSADAVSRERLTDVRPGRPVATEGLEILTTRPQLSTTTLVLARPRNPTIAITFDAGGRVKLVEFLTDGGRVLNSGNRAVDDALIAAVYRWKAKGAQIEALGENETLSKILDISWR